MVNYSYNCPTLQVELKWQHRMSTYFPFIRICCFRLQTTIVQNILEGIVCITPKTAIVALRFRTVHQVLHTQRGEFACLPDCLCFNSTSHSKCPTSIAVTLNREERIVINKWQPGNKLENVLLYKNHLMSTDRFVGNISLLKDITTGSLLVP